MVPHMCQYLRYWWNELKFWSTRITFDRICHTCVIIWSNDVITNRTLLWLLTVDRGCECLEWHIWCCMLLLPDVKGISPRRSSRRKTSKQRETKDKPAENVCRYCPDDDVTKIEPWWTIDLLGEQPPPARPRFKCTKISPNSKAEKCVKIRYWEFDHAAEHRTMKSEAHLCVELRGTP